MKKLSYLLVVFALFSFISLNSCKSSTKPAAPDENVMEESTSQPSDMGTTDSTAADTTSMDTME